MNLGVFEAMFSFAYLCLFQVPCGINCRSGPYLSLGGLSKQAHQLRLQQRGSSWCCEEEPQSVLLTGCFTVTVVCISEVNAWVCYFLLRRMFMYSMLRNPFFVLSGTLRVIYVSRYRLSRCSVFRTYPRRCESNPRRLAGHDLLRTSNRSGLNLLNLYTTPR